MMQFEGMLVSWLCRLNGEMWEMTANDMQESSAVAAGLTVVTGNPASGPAMVWQSRRSTNGGRSLVVWHVHLNGAVASRVFHYATADHKLDNLEACWQALERSDTYSEMLLPLSVHCTQLLLVELVVAFILGCPAKRPRLMPTGNMGSFK